MQHHFDGAETQKKRGGQQSDLLLGIGHNVKGGSTSRTIQKLKRIGSRNIATDHIPDEET